MNATIVTPAQDLANFKAAKKIAETITESYTWPCGADNPFLGANLKDIGRCVIWAIGSIETNAIQDGFITLDGMDFCYRKINQFN